MRRIPETAVVIGILAVSGPAAAFDDASLATSFAASLIAQPADDGIEPAPSAPAPAKYGAKDSWRWMVQGGYGIDIRESQDMFGLLGGGVSYFIIDNLSLDLELNAMYFSQIGDNAFGVNFALLFRWHFIAKDTWSLYFDAGAGMLGTTGKVPDLPDPGSSFNFTPQGGFGFTVQVAENARLFAGARFYHISNAQIYEDNPGRDSLFVYAGVSFPF